MLMPSIFTNLLSCSFLALTVTERWQAAGSSIRNGSWLQRGWILGGTVAILLLTVLFLAVTYNRMKKEKKSTNHLFVKHSRQRGLSRRECRILLDITRLMKLTQTEFIFTMWTVFDRGAAELLAKYRLKLGIKESERLQKELRFLREKLGFRERGSISSGSTSAKSRSRRHSSREIITGAIVYLTNIENYDQVDIKSELINSDETVLTLRLSRPAEAEAGQRWRVRYYRRATILEFDTRTVNCDGEILVLEHRGAMRSVNRRRFARADVNQPAFLAKFPFEVKSIIKESAGELTKGGESFENKELLKEICEDSLKKPEFVPAVLTELGGPGLRMEVPFDTNVGDRVLVVFKKEQEKSQAVTGDNTAGDAAPEVKIVEDIAVVRGVRALDKGFSIAVELTGLSDLEVDELIRVTNTILVRTAGKTENTSKSENAKEKTVNVGAV